MKKYLILMSMAAAGVAFAAATGSRDKDNPTLISRWTDNLTGQIVWRGEGKGVADLTTMTDLYVKADGNYTIGNFTTSGTGGNHTNMHLDLDGNTLTSTSGEPLAFNDDLVTIPTPRSYAAGYYLETAPDRLQRSTLTRQAQSSTSQPTTSNRSRAFSKSTAESFRLAKMS